MPGRSVPVARVDGGGLFLHLGDGAYDLDVAICVHQQRAEGRVPAARDCFETSMARLR